MPKRYLLLFFCLVNFSAFCQEQPGKPMTLTVRNEQQQPLRFVSAEIWTAEKKLLRSALSDSMGMILFADVKPGRYSIKCYHAGLKPYTSAVFSWPETILPPIVLQVSPNNLQAVTVVAKKPFIQHVQGKVLVNPDASVTNAGTTVLELLEKSPGVTVDKSGSIAMQAKTGVLVMIDDKPTQLSGAELTNLLSSMSSAQVEQIELMANPSAKYDASGNAGIINIKTKKSQVKGFNGTLNISAAQGRYPKSNNSIALNFRKGKFNSFFTGSSNYNKYYTDIYALRKYVDAGGNLLAQLDQPTWLVGAAYNNNIRTGLDYYLSKKTTLGISLTGMLINRKGNGDAAATWLSPAGIKDSAINTYTSSHNKFKSGTANINLRTAINAQRDLAIDIDWLNYNIANEQFFTSVRSGASGYSQNSDGHIPSTIKIISARADHTWRLDKTAVLESGWKSSHISTDNLAEYRVNNGSGWQEDLGKSNHFLYKESIHALYSAYSNKHEKFSGQAGLRYEYTSYDAHQLGNSLKKDSAFSRSYSGLFPSGYLSYQMDSSNAFTLTAGRRIDRPAFQKLNPFIIIINKYTHQTGNPFYKPQYSWNMELSHQYKSKLTTTVSYSIIRNYFSQLFLTDSSDILIYSEGNVGRVYNFGTSVSLQLSPTKFWSFSSQALYNHKSLMGTNNSNYSSSINQLNISMNNQFKIGKQLNAELSGFYTGRARNDLQELLYPTGQLSLGFSHPVLKKKGNLKINMRDIFYSQAMEGLTQFTSATEYFILRRDSRVFTLGFTYRFGKPLKAARRNTGGATEESERVGNG